jgi:hypothetical protein
MRRIVLLAAVAGLAALAAALPGVAGKPASGSLAFYPDLRTVVPQHLGIQNQQQRDILRFSNGIANTGGGPWALRPEPPVADATTTIVAMQEIRDSGALNSCLDTGNVQPCYNVVEEFPTSEFEFHEAHNHWHIGDVAQFDVRKGSPTGPIVQNDRGQAVSIKVTFCLIDWYKLQDNPKTPERVFFSCYTSFQGISVGWVDQYHQSTEGQQIDLTGVANGDDYYLVSTANYARVFKEQDYTNNTAWVRFRLSQDSKGNRKVAVLEHSPCEQGTGLCGENTTNR